MKKVIRRLSVTFQGVSGESIAVVEVLTKMDYQNRNLSTPKQAQVAASAWSLGKLIQETGKRTLTIRDDFAGDKISLSIDDLKLSDLDNSYLTFRVYFRPWDSPDPTLLDVDITK